MVVGGVLSIRLPTCGKNRKHIDRHLSITLAVLPLNRSAYPVLDCFFNSFRHTSNSVTHLPSRGGGGDTFRRMVGFNPAQGGVASMSKMAALRDYRNCQKRQVAPILKCSLTPACRLKHGMGFLLFVPTNQEPSMRDLLQREEVANRTANALNFGTHRAVLLGPCLVRLYKMYSPALGR